MKNNFLNLSFSNLFVLLSFIGLLLNFFGFYGFLQNFFGNNIFGDIFRFFIFTFFHGSFIHFFSNAVFMIYFGNIVELLLGKTKYFIFFVFSVIFVGFSILFFSGFYNVIGISGFCMSILSYYTLDLKYKNNQEYKGGIVFIFINILVGVMPGISLLGHVFGMISGIIFYYLNKEFFRKKMIGLVK